MTLSVSYCLQLMFKVNSVFIPNFFPFVIFNTYSMHPFAYSSDDSFGIKRRVSLMALSIRQHDTTTAPWYHETSWVALFIYEQRNSLDNNVGRGAILSVLLPSERISHHWPFSWDVKSLFFYLLFFPYNVRITWLFDCDLLSQIVSESFLSKFIDIAMRGL